MSSPIARVCAALGEENVRYIIVGGVAVVMHGHLRTTADLDLVVQLTPDNAARAIVALQQLDYRPRAPVPPEHFADAQTRESWVQEKGLTVFSLHSTTIPELEVDLFVNEPFDFQDAYSRAIQVELDGTTATVVSLEDLVALKRSAGRTQDLADIEALERLGVEP